MLPSGCMHARSKKGFHIIDGGRGREMEAEAEGARFFSLFRKKRRKPRDCAWGGEEEELLQMG
jgi:hypothetical protein